MSSPSEADEASPPKIAGGVAGLKVTLKLLVVPKMAAVASSMKSLVPSSQSAEPNSWAWAGWPPRARPAVSRNAGKAVLTKEAPMGMSLFIGLEIWGNGLGTLAVSIEGIEPRLRS